MDPTRILLLVQIAVLVVLLAVVIFFLILDRRKKPLPNAFDELKDIIQQTRDLSASFQEQIQIKIDLVNRVMAELDDKIREARLMAEEIEKVNLVTRQSRDFTASDVLKLSRGGYEPGEISRLTGIPLGEVQLMIKMNHKDDA
ncbi:MAG: DUF6115 domain-containing protein [Desulfomonilia bacterium]|uniref:DUF2802 domain-containing protein n=1 Tax=anaerobic digester metagenome TaxID=1263854 RepID=A0A485M117_9ZZZZ|nr:hypothetical protein [Pseudomonadota bacterium]HON39619.1 hypothetical protein [Deltaproteobacteria bacterium]HPW69611.1 hypothetical protein [Deltaproteobacteria bacterium]